MKASELMIGDWVLCKSIGNRYAKIDEIYSKSSPPFKRMLEIVSESDLPYCVPIEEIDPIPLTEELLGHNSHHRVYIPAWGFPYVVIDSEDGCTHILGRFEYVHQLQHALRVCGLNNLADSFKVTP